MTNFIQPFTDEHNNIPPPINEGERILRENMYISIEAVQFCKEFALKKADEEAPFKKNGKKSNIESRQVDEDTYIENEEHFEAGVDNLNRIDKLYVRIKKLIISSSWWFFCRVTFYPIYQLI